ncbi:hypothetical protein ACF0H5_018254 [Mactra antiquata]
MKKVIWLTLVAWVATVTAEFNDLENFIRVAGTLDNTSTIGYINGSVFARQPGVGLKKLFNFEGYNIGRKVKQSDGSFLSLSREFCVYRNPITSQIEQVWPNIWTNKPNEVFYVANDPVNGIIGNAPSWQTAPHSRPLYQVYNADYILEYPNPLAPSSYANYSAGSNYDAVELFGYLANYTQLSMTESPSVEYIGTWVRRSQYLPWMEMSTKPGELYFASFYWKCTNGLSCVADDIMKIINEDYSKFKKAPSTFEKPNETSWTVFKKVIDQRRQAGLPDIIIPQVNTSTNVTVMDTSLDARVEKFLDVWPLSFSANGSAWSEIPEKQSIRLFDIRGFFQLDFERIPLDGGYRVQLDGNMQYIDTKTGHQIYRNYTNPITGQTVPAPKPELGVDYVFSKDSFYTIDIPDTESIGLLGAQSLDGDQSNGDAWSVNFLELAFPYSSLSGASPTGAHCAGTFATFSSWPTWMNMTDVPGNIVMKITMSK